jgi:hypothetical protein
MRGSAMTLSSASGYNILHTQRTDGPAATGTGVWDMNTNIGTFDRNARVTIGLLLVAATVFGFIGLWGFIGIAAVVTALTRVCPAYRFFGYSTCPVANP